MGAANDSYKHDTYLLKLFLRVKSNISSDFDKNIQPKQAADEFHWAKTAFFRMFSGFINNRFKKSRIEIKKKYDCQQWKVFKTTSYKNMDKD